MTHRVADSLNQALRNLLDDDDRLLILGEDLADPYGGAFAITRGLSTRHPGRVLSTPISEGAIAGAACGLALCGNRVIMEVMFGDFITLCFDQIVNFLSKSVSMYGRHKPMPVIVRCPVGGNRGYGPTHSQSLQKHFLGVPNLHLYELTPFHDPEAVLAAILATGIPAIFCEDKVLYTVPVGLTGTDPLVHRAERLDPDGNWVRVSLVDADTLDWAIVAPGGTTPRVLSAMRDALINHEIKAELMVPSRLYPLDLEPVLPRLLDARRILVVDDGNAGGSWAGEVALRLYEQSWGRLGHPVTVLQPPCRTIPAAVALEQKLLVQASTVYRALIGANDG